jgi:hypothetical protein
MAEDLEKRQCRREVGARVYRAGVESIVVTTWGIGTRVGVWELLG